jgi:hypothetical protein
MLLAPQKNQGLSLKEISIIPLLATVSFLFLFLLMSSCMSGQKKKSSSEQILKVVPVFNEDSAYYYLAGQLAFGPRVPNTEGHKACGDYLVEKMRSFCGTVTEQTMQLMAFDGSLLNARNIIVSFNSEKNRRVLLFAHWDTRPWADEDPDPLNRNKAIPGANDGASGVAVLLEIARQLGLDSPASLGIDIILFDAEDYGQPSFSVGTRVEDSWCLGSQTGQKILMSAITPLNTEFLDMVGAKNAVFAKEYFLCVTQALLSISLEHCCQIGYSSYFENSEWCAIPTTICTLTAWQLFPVSTSLTTAATAQTGFTLIGTLWKTIWTKLIKTP